MDNAHIEKRDGMFFVRGARISLDSIVYSFRQGSSPESIREDFEGLRLADVYGAISYYLDHQREIDEYLLQREQDWKDAERQGIPPTADLLARLERARQDIVSLKS